MAIDEIFLTMDDINDGMAELGYTFMGRHDKYLVFGKECERVSYHNRGEDKYVFNSQYRLSNI